MSSSLALAADVLAILIASALDLLAAYKAIRSRKLMTSPAYRSWAALTAAFGVLGIPYYVNLIRIEAGIGFAGNLDSLLAGVISLAGAAVGLALLDKTIKVSLDLDFFHRDILYWQKGGRLVAWVAIGTAAVASQLLQLLNYSAGLIITLPLIAYPIVVLALGTARARDDVMLDYIRWFGLFFVGAVVATTFDFFTGSNFLQILVGFFFYRAAGSLSGSTFHFEVTGIIEAPRDFVFSVYTNPEMMTRITKSYLSVALQRKDPDGRDFVKAETEILGRRLGFTVVRKYLPPDRIEEEAISNLGVGAARFSFVPENEGTRLNISVDFEPRGALTKLFGGFGARRVRSQFEQDYATGKKYCEANRPK